MSFFQNLFSSLKQRSLDKRLIVSREIGWTIQLPLQYALKRPIVAQQLYDFSARLMGEASGNSIYKGKVARAIFSSYYDRFNSLSAAIIEINGASPDQIELSRTDCDDRLFRLYSKIENSTVDRQTSTINVGGLQFQQFSYLIRRGGKPILCYEYSYRTIGDYEFSISMTYNNETQRQTMTDCLADSKFSR